MKIGRDLEFLCHLEKKPSNTLKTNMAVALENNLAHETRFVTQICPSSDSAFLLFILFNILLTLFIGRDHTSEPLERPEMACSGGVCVRTWTDQAAAGLGPHEQLQTTFGAGSF